MDGPTFCFAGTLVSCVGLIIFYIGIQMIRYGFLI